MSKRPAHIPGTYVWECPCEECTELDWMPTVDDGTTLAQYRHEQWPEFWPAPARQGTAS
jgi:hypothetical protein